ncbi:MAG: hypothetical protein WC763_07135 [Candidatus Paceibacterota bacterium]|jgi:hypothetical protein
MMTEGEWKEFEEVVDNCDRHDKEGYCGAMVDIPPILAAFAELKERRDDEEWFHKNHAAFGYARPDTTFAPGRLHLKVGDTCYAFPEGTTLHAALSRAEEAEKEPRIRPDGCQHRKARMIEWINEGACPVCLTAATGINKDRAEEAERQLCAAREVISLTISALTERAKSHDASPGAVYGDLLIRPLKAALSSSSPCVKEKPDAPKD